MLEFLNLYGSEILIKIGEHVFISLAALGLGILVAVPLGILVSVNKSLSNLIITVASILQTIPSLALLAMFVPLIGIGTVPAVSALFVYSLLPIVRNTILGMTSVDVNTLDAAKGMGLTRTQIVRQIQLPLASPIVMAGIRLSGVYVFAWTTLASYIGAGGLGDFVFTGLNNFDFSMILAGTIPVSILALLFDFIMNFLEIKLKPQTTSMKEVK